MFNYNINNYELTSGGIYMLREDIKHAAPRTSTRMPRPFAPAENVNLQGGLSGRYKPVGFDADALARYNQNIAQASNLQFARQYVQPQDLGNGYVSKFNPETGKFELRFNNKIIGREYRSMDEINRLVNASRSNNTRTLTSAAKPEPKTWEKYHRERGTLNYYNRYQKPAPFGGIEADRIAEQKIAAQKAAGGNIARTLTPEAQQALENARRAERGAHFQGTSQQAMNRLHGIGQETDVTKYFRELEAQQRTIQDPIEPEGNKKVKPSRQERLKKIRNNPEARARYNKLKLRNNPELKARFDKFAKFKKMKGLKKAGWIGLGLAAIGALAFGASKCSNDNKPAIIPEKNLEEPTVQQQPVVNQSAEPEYDTFKAIPGSWQWRFAERELLLEHQNDPNYKPSTDEIRERTLEIVARDNREMAEDGIHTESTLMQGDDVTITKPLADLYKEAKEQLLQEHKDEKGYEPTWKEITAIVDEKIKAAKAEQAAA